MKKSKQRFSWAYNHENATVTVVDTTDDTETVFNLAELPDEIKSRIHVYGLGKVLQDRNSGADANDKVSGMLDTFKGFLTGAWKAERTFGARTLPAYIELIVKLKGCSVAQAQTAWKSQPDSWKSDFKDKYAQELHDLIEARKTATDVTLDGLL